VAPSEGARSSKSPSLQLSEADSDQIDEELTKRYDQARRNLVNA
jgi:hypothetical protein